MVMKRESPRMNAHIFDLSHQYVASTLTELTQPLENMFGLGQNQEPGCGYRWLALSIGIQVQMKSRQLEICT